MTETVQTTHTGTVGRLIAAALGWIILAFASSFVLGVLIGLIVPLLHLKELPSSVIASYAAAFGFGGVLLTAAVVRGRLVGSGDVSAGLGNKPVQRLPIIIGLCSIVIGYAIVLKLILSSLDLHSGVRILPSVNLWAVSLNVLGFVVIDPIAEESLFRGWSWTGLQRRWGVLPTAILTSIFWVAGHITRDWVTPVSLIPVVAGLALARHFGQSVRAPIALHAIFNLVTLLSWLLDF